MTRQFRIRCMFYSETNCMGCTQKLSQDRIRCRDYSQTNWVGRTQKLSQDRRARATCLVTRNLMVSQTAAITTVKFVSSAHQMPKEREKRNVEIGRCPGGRKPPGRLRRGAFDDLGSILAIFLNKSLRKGTKPVGFFQKVTDLKNTKSHRLQKEKQYIH